MMMPHKVLNVCVLALTALVRVTRRVRMTSTMPLLLFGIAVDVWLNTALATCSASRRSDLPSRRRTAMLRLLASTTRTC